MEEKEFIQSMRDIATLGNKSVTVAKSDFEILIIIAEKGAKISANECTCMADQYGYMRSAKCILHGTHK